MMKNTHMKFYEYYKILTVVFLVSSFGVVTSQSWNDMLYYAESYVPQLKKHQDYSNTVRFHLWTRLNANHSDHLEVGNPWSLTNSWFDSSKPTHVIIHGYLNWIESPIIQTTKNAILRHCDSNVIGVDWGDIAVNLNYAAAVAHVRGVGNYVCDLLLFLEEQTGLPGKKVHLIGHSLGAHASGFAGKKCQARNFRIGKISGLDPALPGFYMAKSKDRLAARDADFVDCMYTSAGSYGYMKPIGQANFYMNGGEWQPKCMMKDLAGGVCSHAIVIEYYVESVNAHHIFQTTSCKVNNSYQNICPPAQMGYYADPSTQGTFVVKTRVLPPYAREIVSKSNKYCGKFN